MGYNSLQKFHMHYGMSTVARRLDILLLFFSLFCRVFLLKGEIMRGYLKEIFLPLSFLFLRAYFRLNKERNFSTLYKKLVLRWILVKVYWILVKHFLIGESPC